MTAFALSPQTGQEGSREAKIFSKVMLSPSKYNIEFGKGFGIPRISRSAACAISDEIVLTTGAKEVAAGAFGFSP